MQDKGGPALSLEILLSEWGLVCGFLLLSVQNLGGGSSPEIGVLSGAPRSANATCFTVLSGRSVKLIIMGKTTPFWLKWSYVIVPT